MYFDGWYWSFIEDGVGKDIFKVFVLIFLLIKGRVISISKRNLFKIRFIIVIR